MNATLDDIAPPFVTMAHRIVWATCATVDPIGRPRTRVLHPIWEWDGSDLTGWILTSPHSAKGRHLESSPYLSATYWAPNQDTCTADCDTTWDDTPSLRRAGWDRFAHGPEPVGYDPRIVAPWTAPDAEAFGVLRLRPHRLRVMPGEVMTKARADLLQVWRG